MATYHLSVQQSADKTLSVVVLNRNTGDEVSNDAFQFPEQKCELTDCVLEKLRLYECDNESTILKVFAPELIEPTVDFADEVWDND